VMWPDGGPVPAMAVVAKPAPYIAERAGFLPFTLSLSCGTWGGNITTENVNARHFVNLTWVSRPIEPKAISEEALFAAHWQAHGR